MNPTEAKKITALLAMSFPSSQFNEDNARAYEKLLSPFEFEPTLRAVELLAQTQKFLPAISEIRGATIDLERGARRSGAEAWGDVVDEIRRVGAYREPKFSDELTAYAVERCGWRNLCLEGSNDAADRARFIEVYEAASERKQRAEKSGLALPPRGDERQSSARLFAPRTGGKPKLFGAP
jgi:hypothetical protein